MLWTGRTEPSWIFCSISVLRLWLVTSCHLKPAFSGLGGLLRLISSSSSLYSSSMRVFKQTPSVWPGALPLCCTPRIPLWQMTSQGLWLREPGTLAISHPSINESEKVTFTDIHRQRFTVVPLSLQRVCVFFFWGLQRAPWWMEEAMREPLSNCDNYIIASTSKL